MSDLSQYFFDLVHRVEQSGKFQEILKIQEQKYHLHPYKIQGIDCQTIKKTYELIRDKYEITSQLRLEPDNWNQNQRRVFIWFITFYTYFQASTEIKTEEWKNFSKIFFNKNEEFLQFQYLNLIKFKRKTVWSQEEDEYLIKAAQSEQSGKWNEVAKTMFYSSDFKYFKSPKHCRQRWLNHLDSKKKKGDWTAQQDIKIFKYVTEYGKRWSKIVLVLKGSRTEHMIKNRYNSLINKQRKSKKERQQHLCHRIIKLLKKQIFNIKIKKEICILTQQKEVKIQDMTPQQKIEVEDVKTRRKDSYKTNKNSQIYEVQKRSGIQQQHAPDNKYFEMNYMQAQNYYKMLPEQLFAYPFLPEVISFPYQHPVVQLYSSLYWV